MIVIEKLKVRAGHRVQVLSLAREVVVDLAPRGAAGSRRGTVSETNFLDVLSSTK